MKTTVIVSAVRTPIGSYGGIFRSIKAVDFQMKVMGEVLKRAGLDGSVLDQIIFGNIFANLDQNVSRLASLTMGLPYKVPGYTISSACISSALAIIQGCNAIASNQADVVLAGGTESMSNALYMLENCRWGQRLRHEIAVDAIWRSIQEFPIGGGMGLAAERLTEMYHISREEQDALAVMSHQRGCAARKNGTFQEEIVPYEVSSGKGKTTTVYDDEGPREDTSMEKLSKLPPVFKEGGSVTAGNASTMNDGAAAVILMSEEKADQFGLTPMAKIRAYKFVAVDPHVVGTAPVPAIKSVLDQCGLSLGDIGLLEINEAFAAYYIATEKELGLNREITNVNGSGLSVGHPVGATGTRMVVSLIHEMKRRQVKFGISALCGGGGQGTAILLER
jgi:acetyl-CoA C-acetyltransferase